MLNLACCKCWFLAKRTFFRSQPNEINNSSFFSFDCSSTQNNLWWYSFLEAHTGHTHTQSATSYIVLALHLGKVSSTPWLQFCCLLSQHSGFFNDLIGLTRLQQSLANRYFIWHVKPWGSGFHIFWEHSTPQETVLLLVLCWAYLPLTEQPYLDSLLI